MKKINDKYLSDEAIEILIAWLVDIQITVANIVNGLVIKDEGAVRMLERRVRHQDRIVWLNDSRANLGRWIDRKL